MFKCFKSGWVVTLIAVLSTLSASAAEGIAKANETALSIRELKNEVAKTRLQLTTTVYTLQDLVKNPKTDLLPQFKAFTNSVPVLVLQANEVQKHAKLMDSNSEAYLSAWDKQIGDVSSEILRDIAATRKSRLKKDLTKVSKKLDSAARRLNPLMAKLEDVVKFLSVDLTKSGLSTIKHLVWRTAQEAKTCERSINALSEELDQVAKSLDARA